MGTLEQGAKQEAAWAAVRKNDKNQNDPPLRAALVGPQLGLGHVQVRARLLQLEAHVDGLRQRRLGRFLRRRVLPMSVEVRLGLLRRRLAVVGRGGGARGGPAREASPSFIL